MRAPVIGTVLAIWALAFGTALGQVSVPPVKTNAETTDIPAQPGKSFLVVKGSNGLITIGQLSKSAAGNPLNIPPEFTDLGDMLIHTATGIRLPKIHQGCRLAALQPSQDHVGASASFAAGALAEYDCRPSESLTYVQVAFQGSASYLVAHDLTYGLPRIANAVVQIDAKVPNDTCSNMEVTPQSPLFGFAVAQCGVRWANHADQQSHLYGTAAMAIGRGASFILFSNSCVDAQCDVDRPEFGKFIMSFDVSGMHDLKQ